MIKPITVKQSSWSPEMQALIASTIMLLNECGCGIRFKYVELSTEDDAEKEYSIVIQRPDGETCAEKFDRADKLLKDILPLAMGASCAYRDHPEADPTQHCCDWNQFVERICDVLGGGRPTPERELKKWRGGRSKCGC